ncbi:tetrahydrofolate dehydrogenase/cyclohydrolase catalytic domain-containing protein [Caballeronia sp. ATUFL_M1_KS5A]|uniref:tetrahydrofolate dehydrogenase/cyclohydrolase catalytic domain-containing protein n=1 Tax=Caballeronia sp. ATUFL_M1_KS5A TaxID=2921778 RepID=UPI002028CCF3|nr:tetrahydrofolate dehydrogenase/cyclohydrolase catalytic domain-containing protein [Caballeronia sp. ATUFL_M1_KS5A]
MTCIVMDGKALADRLFAKLADDTAALKHINGARTPILATILVGDDPASATYVKMKGNACRRVGMDSRAIVMGADTTTEQLLEQIDALNADPDVHGILLQHPVPPQIDERRCFDRIAITKDVDGVTSLGFGMMALGQPSFGSATPAGIMALLRHYEIDVAGKRAVVVGRSPILGKPMALMLSNANATVTLCHSKTVDLEAEVRTADILVGAVGKPHFIPAQWVRDGAVVVDAGYHPGGIGDIDPTGLFARCAAVTPVPGGVGPMTIAALVSQTLTAAQARGPHR